MLEVAKRRVAAGEAGGMDVRLRVADATRTGYPSDAFDSVVDTFSMCVFDDPVAVLREMKRVVRPGGKVVLLEHSRSDNGLLGAYQDVTAEPVKAMGKGCSWNQDVVRLAAEAGLGAPEIQERYNMGTFSVLTFVKPIAAAAAS
mmetsp:Transcript_28293/g.90496  ORF Transcript_28293/g.90496 Transcript_28293/m.90496 type:complete len:144 (-) Transcript_28293:1645-2076(-)